MKSCGIDDQFVQTLSPGLTDNTSLLHLNLSCNHLGNAGCVALATSLRLNRTLLSVALTCNHIGDEGIIVLAQSKFNLQLLHCGINCELKKIILL